MYQQITDNLLRFCFCDLLSHKNWAHKYIFSDKVNVGVIVNSSGISMSIISVSFYLSLSIILTGLVMT